MICEYSFCHYLLVEDLRPLVYIELAIVVAVVLASLYIYYKKFLWDASLRELFSLSREGLRRLLVYVFLQRRVLGEVYPGLTHIMIFYSIVVLFIATLIRALDYYLYESTGLHVVEGLWYNIYKLATDLAGLAGIVGVSMALYRRLSKMTRDLPDTLEDRSILVSLLLVFLTGFLLDAINYVVYRHEWAGLYNPMGHLFSYIFSGLDPDSIALVYRGLWLFHLTLVMVMISVVVYTKLVHVLAAPLNIYHSEETPRIESTYRPVRDIEKIVEEGRYVGVKRGRDLVWRQRLSLLACTQCARCHNSCPANLSGKILSPMRLVTSMRESVERGGLDRDIVPLVIDPETVWSCVTCGACVHSCPVLINQVWYIADLRRGLFSTGEHVPEEVLAIPYNTLRTGNPYGYNPVDRETWINELVSRGLVELASEDREYDVLYWIGCNTSYDPGLRAVAEAFLTILKRAGLRVAVLPDETCCGEPVRRVGDELTFTEIARRNHERLSRYRFRRLVTTCPHGYTVFTRDYPSIGLKIDAEIIHYSVLLKDLVEKRVIEPGALEGTVVTYHDPCYLGRWNGIYEEPREVIKSIRGLRLVEMPRNRGKSFCCGGGGGHLFFEVKRGVRISRLRVEEASRTGAKILVTACPVCNMMLRAEAVDYGIEVVDLALLLKRSLEKSGDKK